MNYVAAILAGIVAAAAGWFLTGAAAAWIAGLAGMSDFEGARGMFAFLAVGPLGGLVAMVAAAWFVLRLGAGGTSLGHRLARLVAVLAGIAGVVALAVAVRFCSLDTYTDELPPQLEFDLRVPAAAVAEPSAIRVELHTDRNVGDAIFTGGWIDDPGGGRVLSGTVLLAFRTSSRLLAVTLPGEPSRLFRLRLGRDPASTSVPTPWQRADHIDDPGGASPRPAPAGDPVELRYRVRRAGDD